jgi:hypothetical protein
MQIFRVEHREGGHGPYRKGPQAEWICPRHLNTITHPTPPVSDIPWCADKYGFLTLDALVRWFDDEELAYLSNHDFVIRVYEVPSRDIYWRCRTGQCAFCPDDSRVVLEMPC